MLVSASLTAAAGPAPQTAPPDGAPALLDVPYMTQTEDLCGGAAVAMVLRYWGEPRVQPDDFAALIDRRQAGIPTGVLAASIRERGWRAWPLQAGPSTMAGHLARGRPVVALIEVAPRRYHYVVIVAWTDREVILHDPARAPFEVWLHADFDRAWAPTGRWAMLVLPPTDTADSPDAGVLEPVREPRTAASVPGACTDLVEAMVPLATAGRLTDAERGLVAATAVCPGDPSAWRELAGVRFLQSRWREAGRLAEQAARLDPRDEPGWNLLASSRYLADDHVRALEAWNQIDRPRVDLLRIEGAPRTRHPVIADLLDLPPRHLLTPDRFTRAERRLEALPSAAVTRLRYRPRGGMHADVEAVVVEHPVVTRGFVPLAAAAARTWLQREAVLEVASPSRSGELWSASWRWWESRPRVAFGLAVPAPLWLAGVATVEGSWERAAYGTGEGATDAASITRLERRRAAFGLSDWATGRLRWQAGAAFDRWGEDAHASASGALELRRASNRWASGIEGAAWMPLGNGSRFATAGVWSAWRSTAGGFDPRWSIDAGLSTASRRAPFDLWPGAGVGYARAPLLRAHPLLDDGVVQGPAFGRVLAHATLEYTRPLRVMPAAALHLAVFTDMARAWRHARRQPGPASLVDAGIGLRAALPGSGGTLRVDVARGLRDGALAVSAGWQAPWPAR